MCGIFGVLNGPSSGLDEGRARAALDFLSARGPDDGGWFADDGVWLGHRRLTIMDVSEAGHQPMTNEDGSVWITFNGEIYRFWELRRELEAAGHVFRSTSDSEVLIHGYEQWGRGLLDRIDGMFAFAIWDAPRRTLLLARDRLGKKPLFWAERGAALAFSSMVRPLVACGVAAPEIDAEALREYLFLNYVIGPRSIFRGVELLPAGTWLEVRDGVRTSGRYWSLENSAAGAAGADPQKRFEELLVSATDARLVSDVPLGIFLSGGIDSAVVAALAQERSGRRQQTFSVGFDEASYDERGKARAVARRIGSDHHEVECTAADVPRLLPMIVGSADHLLADQSMIPLTRLAEVTSKAVKVVLTGDGGDELLAGYPTYRALRLAAGYVRTVPPSLRRFAAEAAEHLPARDGKMAGATVLSRFLRATTADLAGAHAAWRAIWSESEIRAIFRLGGDGVHPSRRYAEYMRPHPGWSVLQRAIFADISVWLVDSILGKVDRSTMACGLEARSPLLDSRLVEFSFATLLRDPALYRDKRPLRLVAESLLGAELAATPKEPFQTPFAAWFAGPLRPFVRESLATLRETFGEAFDHGALALVEREHAERRRNHDYKIWGLVTLAQWARQYPGLALGSPVATAQPALAHGQEGMR